MNVFLLGNGFDLHHRLPTTYLNFLNTVDFLREHYSDEIVTVGDVFGNPHLQNRDIAITNTYKLHKDGYDKITIDKNQLLMLIDMSKTNIWFSYLLKSFNKNLGWIDFEKEIANVVEAFYVFLSKNETVIYYDSISECILFREIITHFNYFYKVSLDLLRIRDEYLVEVPYGSKYLEINKEKIIDELYRSLRELSEMLRLYLILFVDSTIETLNGMHLILKDKYFSSAYCVFTFNYTETFSKLYSQCSAQSIDVAHIHGDLYKNIVLGINPDEYDELDHIDTSFLCFKKYFQRVFFSTDMGYRQLIEYIKRNKTLFKEYEDIELYVVGHSLDITDEDILKELFELSDKISIFYHKISEVQTYIKNLVKIYGKTEFDRIRIDNELVFYPLDKIDDFA